MNHPVLHLLLVLLSAAGLLAQERPADMKDSAYWQKARALMQQQRTREPLSAQDQAFLAEARALRANLQKPEKPLADTPRTRERDGTEGDNARDLRSAFPAATLPAGCSEPTLFTVTAPDGAIRNAAWRKPPGDGPFPTIVFIHGGLGEMKKPILLRQLSDNPVITRFLAAGYVTVMSTFRTYDDDIQSRAPILDSLAAVEGSAALPFVDAKRLAVYGGSGGGSIALELASIAPVQAVIAGEPATVIYTGMLTTGEREPRLEMMKEPKRWFTPALQQKTRTKLSTIKVPVLILHGDVHDLIHLNRELFLPLMKEAKVDVRWKLYAGYPHGFYFGTGQSDLKVIESVVRETRAFLEK